MTSPPVVLLVEDEMLLAMLLEEFLRKEGFQTIRAGRLDRALAMAEEHAGGIDAAVLDINLGGEKVFPLAERLAEARVPFVFASAYGSKGLPPEFADRPVVPKPYLPSRIASALRGLLPA